MSYLSEQNADTPLSRWKFEETSGTTIDDDQTTTRDGTLTGGVSLNQPAGFTGANLGASFDGSTGFATIANMSTLLGIGTVEAVVSFASIPASARATIFMHSWTSGTIPMVLGFNADNTHAGLLQVGYYTGSGWQTATWTTAPATNTPYHIMGIYDGVTLRLRVNGLEVASTTVSTARATSGTVNATAYIGKFYSSVAFFSGIIWDLALYAGALSDSRSNAHYTQLANPFTNAFASAQPATLAPMIGIDTSSWTTEAGEPSAMFQTGWATFTPSVTKPYAISTVGSNYDTVVAIYTGTALNNLVLVATDDDGGGSGTSLLETTLAAATTYYIQVGAKNSGGGGLLDIAITQRSEARLAMSYLNVLSGASADRQLAAAYAEAITTNTATTARTLAAVYHEAISTNLTTTSRSMALVYYEILTPAAPAFVGWGVQV